MTQQVPPPPSKLRKGFLVVGIVLLVMGFFFFYGASRVNWDYVTTHNDSISLTPPLWSGNFSQFGYPQWGFSYEYYVYSVIMEPNDVITVNLNTLITGTIHIVITTWEGEEILTSANEREPLTFTTPSSLLVYVNIVSQNILVSQNVQNVIVTTQLNHYETPQWAFFGVGVVLSSLAMIPIFKSKK